MTAPDRIWIEEDHNPYYYEESDRDEVTSPVTEYIRADLVDEMTKERDEWKDEYKTAEKGLNVYRKANVKLIKANIKLIAERDAARALLVQDHRSFPDAADGRPMPPMADDLMTAGLNHEDARFVAIQLARNGLTLVPVGNVDREIYTPQPSDEAVNNDKREIAIIRERGYKTTADDQIAFEAIERTRWLIEDSLGLACIVALLVMSLIFTP